jgi:uncharacterized membrane protein (DUF2068 family)
VATVRDQDALLVREPGDGLRWHRCLRCDAWLPRRPPEHPTETHLPARAEIELPQRGKALRDRYVLRLIALDRLLHFLVLGVLAAGVFVFAVDRAALSATFYRVLDAVQGGIGGPNGPNGPGLLDELARAFTVRTSTLWLLGAVLAAYAVLEGVEALGLWWGRRWAEYFTFVATTVLLVPEVYELTNTVTPTKVITLLINLAVVAYLLIAKRLFGVRGGSRAEAAERERESGWAALEATFPTAQAPGPDGGEGVPAGAAR